eukprot:jgi/Tetstr1/443961/TSEL_031912.t1
MLRVRSPDQLEASPVEEVVAAVLEVARLPAAELQLALDQSSDSAAFNLGTLSRGECPRGRVAWLPEQPLGGPAAQFRARASRPSGQPPAIVWYDHLSKAGGSAFCKLAKRNMAKSEVPAYWCMPSYPGMVDARVGQWSNDQLVGYVLRTNHTLVANEWEPFPAERFDMDPRLLQMVFVTSLREPLDRLLSAYRQWPHRPAPNDRKEQEEDFWKWVTQRLDLARTDSKDPRGLGKGCNTGDNFVARIGQPNFATWKFSGGKLPPFGAPFDATPVEQWVEPFSTAVSTLSRFDLAIPLDLLSTEPQVVTDVLGWHDLSNSHVVNHGPVYKSQARSFLTDAHYEELWDANRLDLVLYAWVRAVYLARLHCNA